MGMHKGMCGRQEVNGPASVETLGTYLQKKYPEEMKKKLTFEEWYIANELLTYDKTEYDCMKMSWKAAQQNV